LAYYSARFQKLWCLILSEREYFPCGGEFGAYVVEGMIWDSPGSGLCAV